MDHEKAVVSEKLDDCFILQRVIVSVGYHSEHLTTHAGAAVGLNDIFVCVLLPLLMPDAHGPIDYLLLKYQPFSFFLLSFEERQDCLFSEKSVAVNKKTSGPPKCFCFNFLVFPQTVCMDTNY